MGPTIWDKNEELLASSFSSADCSFEDRYFDDCYFADQFFDSQSVSNLVSAAALALLCLQWFLAAVQVCHTLPGLAPSCWSCLCVQSVCLALAATKVSSCLRGFLWPYSHCLECISFICCSTSFFLQFCLLNKEKNLRLKCEGDHNWS